MTDPIAPRPDDAAAPDSGATAPPAPPAAAPYAPPAPGGYAPPPAGGYAHPSAAYAPPSYPSSAYVQPSAGAVPPPTYRQPAPGMPPVPTYGGTPYGYAPVAPTNGLAITSMVASLAGVVFAWTWVLALGVVVGVITGHIALNQIRQTGARGRGMALTGVIVGWIAIGFAVMSVLAVVIWATTAPFAFAAL
ncbi:DUF4190 domain-containing protein [Microbacterium sp. TNHR37B]|uniref:DUF4190 domain-containing protein n=1 Tax=Microbacterium sp. TNHR37B TaxID=1775956 RepID=UPI0007B18F03|nr:DUF4190 domain-containing protein [Microbacterium sp. TNHR37B]KZE90766.1 hypothetical protein AVP41_00285 [Microbacterium sp. TNHR37B]